MKKLIKIFILVVIITFIAILYVVSSSKRYTNSINRKIIEKTDIKEINYLNEYDGYYLVMDKEYLYVIDNKYKELLRIDQILMHDNNNKCDIIYENSQVMYFDDNLENGQLRYKYYDLYTYELVDEIVLGG